MDENNDYMERSPLFAPLRKYFSLEDTQSPFYNAKDFATPHDNKNKSKKKTSAFDDMSPEKSQSLRKTIVIVLVAGFIVACMYGLRFLSPYVHSTSKEQIAIAATVETTSAAKADSIETIPLFGKPPAPQWSGFLDASASTSGTYLHYWFIHKQTTGIKYPDLSDDTEIPVVIWLNGGPGSSSIFGLLTELGPLILNEDGFGFIENPYSWSTAAHLLVLESPAGVGFSFCKNWTMGSDGVCENSDDSTAEDALAALLDFYETKFPSLRSNPLYITGESYAGVYIPTLAREIINYNEMVHSDDEWKVPLVGLGVGDPCTDNDSQKESFDQIFYSHKHGMITDQLYHTLRDTCHLRDAGDGLYYDGPELEGAGKEDNQELVEEYGVMMTRECKIAFRKYMLQTTMGTAGGLEGYYVDPYAIYEPVDEGYQKVLGAYLNRVDVQLALNIVKKKQTFTRGDEVVPVLPGIDTNWRSTYHRNWTYKRQYDACNQYVMTDLPKSQRPPSMVDIYREISPKLEITIIFNGDSDPCVSYEGTRTAVEKIGFDVVKGGEYRPWFYNATAISSDLINAKPLKFGPSLSVHEAGMQYGGHVVTYENNLSFATVHGSGHMVPQARPRAALQLFQHLISKGHDMLSPKVKSDEDIFQMSQEDLEDYISSWAQMAREVESESIHVDETASSVNEATSVNKKGQVL